MPENRATVRDTNMQGAFMEGFNEAREVTGDAVEYIVSTRFDKLTGSMTFGTLDAAMDYIEAFLANGAGTEIHITCVPKTPPPKAVESEAQEDIEDAEVVDG